MKNVVLVFPGQGSQSIGMGKDLYDKFSYVKGLFDKASSVIDVDMAKMIFEGTEDELRDTYNAQPSIFLISASMLEIIRREGKDINILAVAGHSLGEYSALYSAGVFSFEDGLRIVRKRGELMSKADPEGKGGMAAVIGLDPDKIKEVCDNLTKEGFYVEPVNYNSLDQTVISGYKESISKAVELLKSAGAKRVVELSVSGAFHSKLMEQPAKEFRKFLETFNISSPSIPVIANYNAEPYPSDKAKIIDIMEKQMYSPVLWTSITQKIKSLNPDAIIEVGPGQVLKGLIKKTLPEVDILSFSVELL
ncbi:MAG: ACP S-malonyltransferase [Brevinematales bacterium]|nr:ACP S-malonyltransferase [Brevinematales bacterium]